MALHGIKHHWAEERLKQELARMDLYEHTKERVRRLSGGQVRRVEIARALLHRPELMILDEPTVGLDIPSRQDILAHVRGLCREEGLAVLWATHLIDEVNLSDRVVILHKGRVVANGGVEEVLSETGTENIREAFGRLTGISHQEDL
jgi:ABC-2 type transport system ATP-binding protein